MLNYSFEPIHAMQEYNEEWLNSFITLPLQEYLQELFVYLTYLLLRGVFSCIPNSQRGVNLPMRNKVCNYWRREKKRQSSESDSPERSIGHFFLWSTQENNISYMKMFCFRVHALEIKSVLRISYLAALSSAVLSSVNGSWGSFLSW